MRSYICRSCDQRVTVGHPPSIFLRRARAITAETRSLLSRLFRRGKSVKDYVDAMEERHYLEPDNFRTRPGSCPHCGYRGSADLPWWRPGASFEE